MFKREFLENNRISPLVTVNISDALSMRITDEFDIIVYKCDILEEKVSIVSLILRGKLM